MKSIDDYRPDRIEEVVFKPTIGNTLFLFVASVGFVAVGIWMIVSGEPLGWLAMFFAFGIPMSILRLLPGASYLKFDQEGFTWRECYRGGTYCWSDVTYIATVRVAGQEMVGFNLSENASVGKVGVRRLNVAICGAEFGFIACYGMTADQMGELMSLWRARYA